MRKILFVCKVGHHYGNYAQRRSTGLYTSTGFIVSSLQKQGVECKLAEAIDNNCIDRLVNEYKPDTVIIEALWVVPEKFPILMKLHPKVEWFVRLHSNVPFLALEGISTDWMYQYDQLGIEMIVNCERLFEALKAFDPIYLPNIYAERHTARTLTRSDDRLSVGCFGAVRPLKNQLIQAMAAIEYAKETGRNLNFYINGTREENGGEPVIKSIRNLFKDPLHYTLIEVPWMHHSEFKAFLSLMDISMQVSLSETFNIVTADAVSVGTPIVVSPEVLWASRWSKADPHSVNDIKKVMARVEAEPCLAWWNGRLLRKNALEALKHWMAFVTT